MSSWKEEYPWAERCARLPAELFEAVGRPREEWGPGPWQDEPDVVRFTTRAGLRGLIWRAPVTGSLCGYAELKPGHPFFCKPYRQLEQPIEAHGGLTFSGTFDPDLMKSGLGELAEWLDAWWIGFDCAHFGDVMPALNAVLRDLRSPRHWPRYAAKGQEPPPPAPLSLFEGTYWTIEAVRLEVEDLAAQLARADNPAVREALDAVRAREEVGDR